MAGYDPPIGARCCTPSTPGLRMLIFRDGTQAGVFGLNEIFAELYGADRPVNAETAEEIVQRLSINNYVAPAVRHEYCDVVIEEYRKYVESRRGCERGRSVTSELPHKSRSKAGLLRKLFGWRRSTPPM